MAALYSLSNDTNLLYASPILESERRLLELFRKSDLRGSAVEGTPPFGAAEERVGGENVRVRTRFYVPEQIASILLAHKKGACNGRGVYCTRPEQK